jgi:hypothetical protein
MWQVQECDAEYSNAWDVKECVHMMNKIIDLMCPAKCLDVYNKFIYYYPPDTIKEELFINDWFRIWSSFMECVYMCTHLDRVEYNIMVHDKCKNMLQWWEFPNTSQGMALYYPDLIVYMKNDLVRTHKRHYQNGSFC